MTEAQLKSTARNLRVDLLRMFRISGTGHLAPALSCLDILNCLYFAPIINYEKRFAQDRDRVILSKGHGCAALYAVLARAGFFKRDLLWTFYQSGTLLGGHPNIVLPGIESATGALGHGICFATGTAKAAKLSGENFRSYVVVGDGECDEGSVWEAAMFAANNCLDNLTVIIDHNGLQASDRNDNIAPLGDLAAKWEAFGWKSYITDGHDYPALINVFEQAKKTKGIPSVIIASTIKGKGISFAEDNIGWHSRAPKGDEWDAICNEYHISKEDLLRI